MRLKVASILSSYYWPSFAKYGYFCTVKDQRSHFGNIVFKLFVRKEMDTKLTIKSLNQLNRTVKIFQWHVCLKFFQACNKQTKISLATRKTTFWLNMDRHRNKTTIWISSSGCIFNSTNLEEISEENWMHIFHPRKSYEHLKTCSHVGNVDL